MRLETPPLSPPPKANGGADEHDSARRGGSAAPAYPPRQLSLPPLSINKLYAAHQTHPGRPAATPPWEGTASRSCAQFIRLRLAG